jgi:hypothetical protein
MRRYFFRSLFSRAINSLKMCPRFSARGCALVSSTQKGRGGSRALSKNHVYVEWAFALILLRL